MKNNLWKSSEELVKNSNLNNFEKFKKFADKAILDGAPNTK